MAFIGSAAGAEKKRAGCGSVEIDGRLVPLSREGVEKALGGTVDAGKRLGEAVSAALERAIEA